MAAWIITMLLISEFYCYEEGVTPFELSYLDDIKNLAGFGDAHHRGPEWYDYTTSTSAETGSDLMSKISETSSSITSGSYISSSESSEASSVETKERRRATQTYRVCTPCPHDMMKQYKNFGIKWICGGYQRARRSFKSECMMRYRNCQDGTTELVAPLIDNKTIHDVNNSLKLKETRRSHKISRSTSSSSGDPRSESDDSAESLGLTVSSSSSSETDRNRYKPKSTEERKGWRKWHRKCHPCPEDMMKKWRDRSIKWVCGGYQRARRSFKSECMMHYRNCQDGTMFVKIHDHRCQNDTGKDLARGLHFFYDYGKDSQDSSSKLSETDSSSAHISSEFYG
ncbi:uncharacterized protein [Epargyreus clarus]|uniref:uncharacterized protein n=1 Tax=Epargyreus clarus TaxID=520877 RepID=UPI003C2E5D89